MLVHVHAIEKLHEAGEDVVSWGLSQRAAADKYHVPRSIIKLKVKRKNALLAEVVAKGKWGHPTVFTADEKMFRVMKDQVHNKSI